jgi:membrane fusion protein, multidrug efflux system
MITTTTLNRKPWLIAVAIVLLLALWMLSGAGKDSKADAEQDKPIAKLEKETLNKVRVERRVAEPIFKVIELHGRTEADRRAKLTAQVSGRVEAIHVARGQSVAKDQLLVTIEKEDRELRLQKSLASLKQRELEFQGSERLRQQGLNAQTKLAESEANLELAKAEVEEAKLAIKNTEIRAPFAGLFNERTVEVGDLLSVGSQVGEILDVDPIVVRGNIPELEFAEVKLGQSGYAKLISGQSYNGKVRYLSSASDDATHTFRVELAIDNPDNKIPVGISASIGLQTRSMLAHKISPAILALGDNGGIGVKVIDENNHVFFKEVKLIRSEADGSWIDGLDREESIITLGQGFVAVGDEVAPDFVNEGGVSETSLAAVKAEETHNE